MSANTGDKVWSENGEKFMYDSLGDLLDSCDDLILGSVVYVGEVREHDASKFCDADDVIETIGERAYDVAGEFAEDYPDVSLEARQELNAFLSAWIEKNCKPTFYAVKNSREYTITADDIKS